MFVKGVPELQIPVLDPLYLDRINLNTGNGTAVNLNAVFTDIILHGCSNVDILKLSVDVMKKEAELRTFFPHVMIKGDYKLKGKFLILQLNGAGKSVGNFSK